MIRDSHDARSALPVHALARHWTQAQQHLEAGEPAERDDELRDIDALLAEWFVDDGVHANTADEFRT